MTLMAEGANAKVKTKYIIKKGKTDRLFNWTNISLLFLLLVIMIYPLIYVVSNSFSGSDAIMSGKVWLWPIDFSFDGYKAVFAYQGIWRAYANTVFYTVAGTLIGIIMTLLAACPLSRADLYGRKYIMVFFTFTMFFSGGLIPFYRLVSSLKLIHTIWSMIIPSAMSVWNVLITKTFLQSSISNELVDAAKIDGCNDFMVFRRIVIPLSGAIIAVNAIFYGVGFWNSYFNAYIFLTDQDLYPLQLVLRSILVLNKVDLQFMPAAMQDMARKQWFTEIIKYSIIVVSTAPILVIYPFFQRYFVKGIMIGSIKG